MNNILTIARKEFRDTLHSRLLLVVLAFLAMVTLVSVLVSSIVFDRQVTLYSDLVKTLAQLGKTPVGPAPEMHPLNLLRGVVEYVDIIGAVLGMVLGYLSVSREKTSRALKLILTRPITRVQMVAGKMLGNVVFIVLTLLVIGAFSSLGLMFIGRAALSLDELLKLGMVLLMSMSYILVFFSLTFLLSLLMKTMSNALAVSFVLWLLVVLIMPQIGDTMDPDNQVPGGFFNSMNFTKPQEEQVMAQFSSYETVRNAIEQASITKRYERTSFALLGVKQQYNGTPLAGVLRDEAWNMLAVFGLTAAGLYACGALVSGRRDYLVLDMRT